MLCPSRVSGREPSGNMGVEVVLQHRIRKWGVLPHRPSKGQTPNNFYYLQTTASGDFSHVN